MNSLKQHQADIILISSLLIIGLFLTNFIMVLLGMRGENNGDVMYELVAFSYQLPFLLPAFLGLWKRQSARPHLLLILSFFVYTLVGLYIYTAFTWATNPLQPGIMFIVIGLPLAIALSIGLLRLTRSTVK